MIVWGGSALLPLEPAVDRQADGNSHDPDTGEATPIIQEIYRDGAAYSPATDSWRELPPVSVANGAAQKAFWTGKEMLLWLARNVPEDSGEPRLVGLAYEPASDSWRIVPPHPYGSEYAYATVWTGEEVIIAAGIDYTGKNPPRGAAYSPASDTWREITTSSLAPPDWSNAVMAGDEMIVWGGGGACEGCPPWSGGFAYEPATDTWRQLAEAPIPDRAEFESVWTGDELIVWSGQAGPYGRSDGAAYTPATDTWRTISKAPIDARYWSSIVWSGTEMIIWGGYNFYAEKDAESVFGDGAAYDPVSDSWRQLPQSPLAPRCDHSGVWAGTQMILWGGTRHCGSMGPRDADGAALTS